jgi:hypothetical protein
MINLAAAAVLVRDLTEQHLAGASESGPGERSRQAGAGRSRPAPRGSRIAPAPSARQAAHAPSHPSGARRRMPRSA